ncbi:YkgJ family cysteine cluster protein [Pelagicoccus albus]|uniref:YkgJ family cysteine cluster protein n=1 Tax=Pelagicoccus albus TaxID=415222 RepID=A0A7X1B6J1_9BACT|nr:YkgJ family cysteine cluster protein [Pelagicoccus albus]MBC2606309.1 YkgJ family cysteine cluster protein [Pelagicoccus albus]
MKDTYQILQAKLRGAIGYRIALNVLKDGYTFIGDNQQKCIDRHSIRLDCTKGCSHCCHFRVDARSHEILLIASFIKERWTDEDIEELKKSLVTYKEAASTLSYTEHMATNMKCPLLKNGSCSVYQVRPMGCRRHHAQDVKGCIYSYEHPNDLEFPGTKSPTLIEATGKAENLVSYLYMIEGYDSQGYELASSLLEAIDSTKPFKRWKNKKKTFTTAIQTPKK